MQYLTMDILLTFPGVWDWLKECTILTRMYYNDGGDGWSTKTNWLGSEDWIQNQTTKQENQQDISR